MHLRLIEFIINELFKLALVVSYQSSLVSESDPGGGFVFVRVCISFRQIQKSPEDHLIHLPDNLATTLSDHDWKYKIENKIFTKKILSKSVQNFREKVIENFYTEVISNKFRISKFLILKSIPRSIALQMAFKFSKIWNKIFTYNHTISNIVTRTIKNDLKRRKIASKNLLKSN